MKNRLKGRKPPRSQKLTKHASSSKRERQSRQQSQAHLQAILNDSPVLIFIKDPRGHYLEVNRQFEKRFGLAREQVIGKTDAEIFPSEQAEWFRANDLKVLQSNVPLEFEEVTRSGDTVHTSVVYDFPLHDAKGRVDAVCGVVIDISERRAMENALRESEARNRAVVESARDAIVTLDRAGKIIELNPAASRMFGHNRTEIVGHRLAEALIHPAMRQVCLSWFAPYLATREGPLLQHHVELSATRADGSEFPIELSLARVSTTGSPIFTAYIRDKTSTNQLENTNRLLEQSLNDLAGFYAALTPLATAETTQQLMEAIIARLLEATGADAALIRLWDEEANGYPVHVQRGFSMDYVNRIESVPSGGAVEWVCQHAEPIIAEDITLEPKLTGKIQLELGFRSCAILPFMVHDEVRGIIHLSSKRLGYFNWQQQTHLMTIARQMGIALENRELFHSLSASRAELEKANKTKDEFLNAMSHELRTPLNVIMGYIALLQDQTFGQINEKQKQAMKTISGNSEELLRMINDVLLATEIESGKVRLRTEPVLPAELLDELRSQFDLQANKALTLHWDYSRDLPCIHTDGPFLKRVLENLIRNAIKFTDQGHIRVSAHIFGQTAEALDKSKEGLAAGNETPWLHMEIADTGCGIPQSELGKIFQMFYQVDNSMTRRHDGVGLGLYIAKKIIELLHGKIKTESTLDRGSTFTVQIPIATPTSRSRT